MSAAYTPVLLPTPGRTTPVGLAEYQKRGGYVGWKNALAQSPADVIEKVKASGLRGRGGAGFPTGLKWSFVPKGPGPKYLVVNADESEPGTFKDREIMEIEPHTLIEGVAIGSYAIGAELAFIYIRGEYTVAADTLEVAIDEAKAAGLIGPATKDRAVSLDIIVFRGAGAYICGEETALLESLEGKRPMPRARPPFPAIAGLYAKPTVVNNVETIANVPLILAHGVEWYTAIGIAPANTGPKLFSLSGAVQKPGNYELPLGGATFRELIDVHGGGVLPGRTLRGVLPAGVSAPILPASKLDVRLDYDSVKAAGSMLGSASIIVVDDSIDMVRAATRMIEFFRHESCGKCTPCREGTMWLEKVYHRIGDGKARAGDVAELLRVSKQISGNVLCALGDFATSPVTSTIEHFRGDYERLIPLGKAEDGRAADRGGKTGAAP